MKKAIYIDQFWAELIMKSRKANELRKLYTSLRGLLTIRATKMTCRQPVNNSAWALIH